MLLLRTSFNNALFTSTHKTQVFNMCTDLSINRFNLLQGGQHKHSRLAHTRLGLTEDVHTQDSLWDALMLDCRIKTHQKALDLYIHMMVGIGIISSY